MKVKTSMWGVVVASVVAALALILASMGAAGAGTASATAGPEADGAAAVVTSSDAADAIPDYVPVAALDGSPLVVDGKPVTVPAGLRARGEISESQAKAAYDAAFALQAQDACRRNVQVPVGAAVPIDGPVSEEEFKAAAEKALAKAIKENGGRRTKSAC